MYLNVVTSCETQSATILRSSDVLECVAMEVFLLEIVHLLVEVDSSGHTQLAEVVVGNIEGIAILNVNELSALWGVVTH